MSGLYQRGRLFALAYWAGHTLEETVRAARQVGEAGEPVEYVAGAADVVLDITQAEVLP